MLKLSQFEVGGKHAILYPISGGYVYFDNYRTVGTAVHLKHGDSVSAIVLIQGRRFKTFVKEFNELTKS